MKQTLFFESILKQEMEKFLKLRKSQGHAVDKEKSILITTRGGEAVFDTKSIGMI